MCASKVVSRANTIRRKHLSFPLTPVHLVFLQIVNQNRSQLIPKFYHACSFLYSKIIPHLLLKNITWVPKLSIFRVMTSLQDFDLFQDFGPFLQDANAFTSILTTGFQESVRILSSALFDTSSDLTTTFFTVLLMVLTATMVRMMFEGRTTPVAELEKVSRPNILSLFY